MEKYRELVRELNQKNVDLQKRLKRCEYLRVRLNAMVRCGNREQAEAYTWRINQHKPRLIDTLEEIEGLEKALKKMPRKWIV